MSETTVESPSPDEFPRPRPTIDLALSALAWLLVIAILGVGAYFAYSVRAQWDAAKVASPALRTIEALKRQVSEKPDDPMRRVRLGEALGAAGYSKQAIEQFQVAIDLNPEYVGAYMDIGFVSMIEKDYGNAEKAFRKVLELTNAAEYENINELREQALFYLGEIALVEERYEDAAGDFKGAIRIRKDSSDSYLRLAQAFIGMGEFDAAEQQLSVALMYDPNFAEAHYELGRVYMERDQVMDAAWQFRLAADLSPKADQPREALAAIGSFDQFYNAAVNAYEKGDLEAALNSGKIARALDQERLEGYQLHAKILEGQGNPGEALKVYEEAQKLIPENQTVIAELSRLQALVKKEGAK